MTNQICILFGICYFMLENSVLDKGDLASLINIEYHNYTINQKRDIIEYYVSWEKCKAYLSGKFSSISWNKLSEWKNMEQEVLLYFEVYPNHSIRDAERNLLQHYFN